MTTKEKVIRESIKRVTKQINKINLILNANPLSDIIKLRRDTLNNAKEFQNHEKALVFINKAIKKEKELIRIAKKQQNSIKLINEKVKLELELSDLNGELWHIERRNKR